MDKTWSEILNNTEIVNEMANIDNPEELQRVLKTHGYEFTLEEIVKAGDELYAEYGVQSGGELDEGDLEEVAGGIGIGLPLAAAAAGAAANRGTRCRCKR